MSYGKHQSFYNKKNWINKTMRVIENNNIDIFNSTDNYKDFGIGKNMFQSLKYWIEAFNIINFKKKEFTDFGELLKLHDPAADMIFSLNLIHYFLISKHTENVPFSHVFYWFFNINQEISFSKDKLLEDYVNWSYSVEGKQISETTLKRDIDCLIATYTNDKIEHPEDKNVSLLATLKLIKQDEEGFNRIHIEEGKYSLNAVYYIILKMKENRVPLNLENILNYENSPGKIFNLDRASLIHIIDSMISKSYPISVTRTNNLDTVNITYKKSSQDYLNECYERLLLNENSK